jgi:hypothetical protein
MVGCDNLFFRWWRRGSYDGLPLRNIGAGKQGGREALGSDALGSLCRGCMREREREDAITYYRENLGAGEPAHFDPFPKG